MAQTDISMSKAAAWSRDKEAKVASFQRMMRAVNRILSYNAEELEIVTVPTAIPGWTDGAKITLNENGLPPLVTPTGRLDVKALMVWLGVNSHEVGHTLWTPRKGSPLMAKLKQLEENGMYRGIGKVENMVEDQRMERLTIGRFRPWGVYLTAAAVHIIASALADEATSDGHDRARDTKLAKTWPLLVGRTWLPPEFRKAARDAWPGDGKRLATLVGRYQRLPDPGYDDAAEAVEILMELHTLLHEATGDVTQIAVACKNQTNRHAEDQMGGGDMPDILDVDDDAVPSAGSDQDNDALDAAGEPDLGNGPGGTGDDSADADADAGDGQGTGDSADGDTDGDGQGADGQGADADGDAGDGDGASSGSGDGDGDADTDGSGDADGGSEDDIRMSDSDGDGTGAGNESSTDQRPPDPTLSDLDQAAGDAALEQLGEDARAQRDLDEIKDALDDNRRKPSNLDTEDESRKAWSEAAWVPASQETRQLAREVSDHLRHLVDASLPHWIRRTDSGKLNVGRYMRRRVGDPYDTMFDRFAQGLQDDISLEVWILVDTSTSMHNTPDWGPHPDGVNGSWPKPIDRASEAMWAVRRAVEVAEGRCTVIGFSTKAYEIAGPNRRPNAEKVMVVPTGGGTNPTDAINEVWRQAQTSEAAHKVVVAITDGDWAGGGPTMQAMETRGIITIGVQLETYCKRPPWNKVAGWNKQQRDDWMASQWGIMERRSEQMGTTYTKIMEDCHEMVELFDQVVSTELAKVLSKGGV